jgi:hypothetical protein
MHLCSLLSHALFPAVLVWPCLFVLQALLALAYHAGLRIEVWSDKLLIHSHGVLMLGQ